MSLEKKQEEKAERKKLRACKMAWNS